MSDLLGSLELDKRGEAGGSKDFCQLRRVPLQPPDVPITHVWMGNDLGSLPWSGGRPRAGDTVAVVGIAPNQTVIAREQPVARNPVFGDRCICRCPGSSTSGLIFLLNNIRDTTVLLVVDGATGDVVYFSTLPEVFSGAGIAVDPAVPHDLYILDDRSGSQNLPVDSETTPNPDKQWNFMLKYTLSGNAYAFSTAEIMPGYPTENPFSADVNSLAVIDGVCWICLASEPATIRRWSGSGFTDLALTLNGDPYVARLLGPAVQVTTRPAPTSSYFVLALIADTTYELVQFNASGEIQQRLQDAELVKPKALLSVCNRLFAMNADGASRSDDFPEEGEGGDGGGGGGGGEEA